MQAAEWFQQSYPWTAQPLITNAPMSQYVSPLMVTEVTRAGGLGFLGAGYDVKSATQRLQQTRELFGKSTYSKLPTDGSLPVGIGVLCFTTTPDAFADLLKEYKPVAVWLFAAKEESDYAIWAQHIRKTCNAHIWIQTNSVANAVNLARTARPDVLVIQGSDAGGHGSAKGAGIVSLLPETMDALAEAGFGSIPLIAAGGLADGRGVAASLTLGASGVTLGTRFLASDEVSMADKAYQNMLLATRDGGQTTTKSQIFDDVQFADGNIWPQAYDGRALRNAMVDDAENGIDLKEARKLYAQDKGFKASMVDSRAVAWSGTGVGLVRDVKPSYEIVTETRNSALKILRSFSSIK